MVTDDSYVMTRDKPRTMPTNSSFPFKRHTRRILYLSSPRDSYLSIQLIDRKEVQYDYFTQGFIPFPGFLSNFVVNC